MSELNDVIKDVLLANGFVEIDVIPKAVTNFDWDYQYHNGDYYIYFDEGETCIKARYNNDTLHKLFDATAEQVIAYFTEHGKAPEQESKQSYMPLGQQMWDYLLSIGFEKIDNNDSRLGCPTGLKYRIAKGNLCVVSEYLKCRYLNFIDLTSKEDKLTTGCSSNSLNIRSVADLQAWLQYNNYLDDNRQTNNATELAQKAPDNSNQHIQQRDIPYTRKDVAAKLNSMGYNQCNWTTRTLQVKDKQGNMLGVAYSHTPNFEAVIEAMIGEKLELRKPKFGAEEAVKMLLDNGWQNDEHSMAEKGYFTLNTNEDMLSIYIAKKRANIQISALELNEHNIGVVIKIAQLSKQFKSSSND